MFLQELIKVYEYTRHMVIEKGATNIERPSCILAEKSAKGIFYIIFKSFQHCTYTGTCVYKGQETNLITSILFLLDEQISIYNVAP